MSALSNVRVYTLATAAATVLAAANTWAATSQLGPATITSIGSPTWEPQGIVLFSAPIGTGSDGYAELPLTLQAILPPPNHAYNPAFGIIPGSPHAGPYGQELANGVSNQGYKLGPNFTTDDFSNGKGITLAWIFVPSSNAPNGSSPDFASGPIIPNTLFPISQTGITTRNGQTYDTAWTFSLTDVNSMFPTPPATPFEGTSHFPQFETESSEFGPAGTPVAGSYTESFTITDVAGNGWTIDTSFTVSASTTAVPLPRGVWPGLAMLSLAIAGELVRRRRRLA